MTKFRAFLIGTVLLTGTTWGLFHLTGLAAEPMPEFRRWTDAAGQRSRERASFVGLKEGSVTLRRESNGATFTVRLSQLSPEDRRYIYARLRRRPTTRRPNPSSPTGPRTESPSAPPSEPQPSDKPKPEGKAFPIDRDGFRTVNSILAWYCGDCHSEDEPEGGLNFDAVLTAHFDDSRTANHWREVLDTLNLESMPPPEADPLPNAQRRELIEWVERELRRAETWGGRRRSGLRRLNRTEYANSIAAVFGHDFDVADIFPQEGRAAGFDNNADALSLSGTQLELYFEAAERIADRVLHRPAHPGAIDWRFEAEAAGRGGPSRVTHDGQTILQSRSSDVVRDGAIVFRTHHQQDYYNLATFEVPEPGWYHIRIHARGVVPEEAQVRRMGPELRRENIEAWIAKQTSEADRSRSRDDFSRQLPGIREHFDRESIYRYGPPRMQVVLTRNGRNSELFEGDVPADARPLTMRVWLAGRITKLELFQTYHLPLQFENTAVSAHERFPRPELLLDRVELSGPFATGFRLSRDNFADVLARLFRRPVPSSEAERYLGLSAEASVDEHPLRLPLIAALCSGSFLMHAMPDAETPSALDAHALASRLSFFLWAGPPDEELRNLADSGRLNETDVLTAQVDRMLADARSEVFLTRFVEQWLGLDGLGTNPPVPERYPRYDEHLEESMRREPTAFLRHLLNTDRPLTDLLDADDLVINERLARFYGVPNVSGDDFRVVPVPASGPASDRGGLITMAGVLALTSNGTRTSPVWRGEWILDRLFGQKPPAPPAGVADIPVVENFSKLTLRERLAVHRQKARCARCHDRIDPLGLPLESFDAAGRSRTQYATGPKGKVWPWDKPVDSSTVLADGTRIENVNELKGYLLRQRNRFAENVVRRLLTYALSRPVGLSDRELIEEILRTTGPDPTLRHLLRAIVVHDSFRTN